MREPATAEEAREWERMRQWARDVVDAWWSNRRVGSVMREEGYYRVLLPREGAEAACWLIAEWGDGAWWCIGKEYAYPDASFAKIDERRIEMPDDAPSLFFPKVMRAAVSCE